MTTENTANSNRQQSTYHFPLKIKIALSIVSLFVFLAILEIGLRAVGESYSRMSRWPEPTESKAEGLTNILCIGDSFTHGGKVARDETYPAILQKRFDSEMVNQEYTVFNGGVCETNSTEVYRRLVKWLKLYDFDYVVLLVGSANRFNPWDYELYADRTITSYLKSQLFDLRVIKMFRIIYLNLKARKASLGPSSHTDIGEIMADSRWQEFRSERHEKYLEKWKKVNSDKPNDKLYEIWFYFNADEKEKALKLAEAALDQRSHQKLDIMLALVHFYSQHPDYGPEDFEPVLERAKKNYSRSEKLQNALAYYYREIARIHRTHHEYGQAIAYFLKAIRYDPSAYYNYYSISKLYDLQSYYDSNMIYKELKKIEHDNPTLKENKMFSGYLKIYSDKKHWESGVEQWLAADLEKIVALCKKHQVKLIIQNYPVAYAMANRALGKIAAKYKLSFVDNESAFKALKPTEKYFFDDDHCTYEGHKIMAANVYSVINPQQ